MLVRFGVYSGMFHEFLDASESAVMSGVKDVLSFDAKELGMVACRTLLDLTEGLEVKERTLLPYEVVLKESTK